MSIFPSENTWITPRTKDVKITTDNCMLILPKKISHIEQVYLNANSFALWNLKGSDAVSVVLKSIAATFFKSLQKKIARVVWQFVSVCFWRRQKFCSLEQLDCNNLTFCDIK